jgi:glycosyltransferase involved in cell wall biosynthesis
MRVLHVVTAFPRTAGDVITPWLIETLTRLKQRGVEVEVFTSAYRGLGDQELFGIPVHRFRYFPKRWEDLTHDETTPDRMRKGLRYKLMALTYVLGGWAAIGRLCRRRRFDIVHIHWPFPHAAFGPPARAAGARVISSFYGVELRWVKSRLPVFKPFVRWAVRSADAVTAISTHTAREIRELASREVSIIPFGAAVRTDAAGSAAGSAPGSKEPVILFAGRLVERKGVRYLIDALRLVRERVPARLVIVGQGSERPALEARVRELGLSDAVRFTGFVSAAELEALYRGCSLFVLPAVTDAKGDTEGLGTVLLDAMTLGKPVIASNTGGITDIVQDRRTGLLVPERDSAGLARAILQLLEDAVLARKLAEQGCEYARGRFGWDRIVDALIELYGTTASRSQIPDRRPRAEGA